jgi:transcriptional regulator with XRE-family HTH domain
MVDSTGRAVTGSTLARIRQSAGLTQAELAKSVPMSPATISRIESAEADVTTDELKSLLRALDTEEAADFCSYLEESWTHLAMPPFHHPDRQHIVAAERALQAAGDLKSPDAKAAFVRQVELYEDEIKAAAGYLRDLTHDVAFVGSIGVGKSTAICSLAGLRLEGEKTLAQEMVLEVGGGGTTICEVQVTRGPQYGLIAEPRTDADLRQDVADFSEYLVQEKEGAATDSEAAIGVSRELDRAIRNMSGLIVVTHRDADGRRTRNDPARELASKTSSASELAVEILARMNLPRRNKTTVWYSPEAEMPPLKWLQRIFAELNNGRHAEFLIPDRIQVVLPNRVFEHADLELRVIDTRGIDQAAGGRADIECHFDNRRTMVVLCSGFMDAPEDTVQLLLQRAREAGVSEVEDRTLVLVLAKPSEALSMKDDSGVMVSVDDEGYDIKEDQVHTALGRLGMGSVPICFYNAVSDQNAGPREQLLSVLQEMRRKAAERITGLSQTMGRLADNLEKEEAQAVINDATRRISIWLDTNDTTVTESDQIHRQLLRAIRAAHARSIWASTRRKGTWSNLDYYYQLGRGARTVAAGNVQQRVGDLRAVIQNVLDDVELSQAHDFIGELQLRVERDVDELLQRLQLAGRSAFEEDLSEDVDFWERCESRWGGGAGYRDDIASYSDDWFVTQLALVHRDKIMALIDGGWSEIVQRVRDLIIGVSPPN